MKRTRQSRKPKPTQATHQQPSLGQPSSGQAAPMQPMSLDTIFAAEQIIVGGNGSAIQRQHAMLQLQRTRGNRAVQNLIQRAGVDVAPRANTEFKISKSIPKLGFEVTGKVAIKMPDPDAGDSAQLKLFEGQTSISAGSVQFGTALAKYDLSDEYSLPILPGLKLGPPQFAGLDVSADDESFDVNLVKAGVALQGEINKQNIQSPYLKQIVGNPQMIALIKQGKMTVNVDLEFSLALSADNALRLARAVKNHRELIKMSKQNAAWVKKVKDLNNKQKALKETLKNADGFIDRFIAKGQLARNRMDHKVWLRNIAKNRKAAESLIKESMSFGARLAASGFGRTVLKFIPVINVVMVAADVYSVGELIYGLYSGKEYTFGFGEGGAGVSGEGEGMGTTEEGGNAAQGEASSEGGETETGGDVLAGEDDIDEDGLASGEAGSDAGPQLHGTAQEVFEAVQSGIGQGTAFSAADLEQLNGIVPDDLTDAEKAQLMAYLKTSTSSGGDVFDVMGEVVAYIKMIKGSSGAGEGTQGLPGEGEGTEGGYSGTGDYEGEDQVAAEGEIGDDVGGTVDEENLQKGEQSAQENIEGHQSGEALSEQAGEGEMAEGEQHPGLGEGETADEMGIDADASDLEFESLGDGDQISFEDEVVMGGDGEGEKELPDVFRPEMQEFHEQAVAWMEENSMNGYAETDPITADLKPSDLIVGRTTVWHGKLLLVGDVTYQVIAIQGDIMELKQSAIECYDEYGMHKGRMGPGKVAVQIMAKGGEG